MDRLFSAMRDALPAFKGAAIGSLDQPEDVVWHDAGAALHEGKAEVLALLDRWRAGYEALGGRVDVGSDDEILISASRLYLLARIDHDSGVFVLVALGSQGNIGYLRFLIRGWLRAAKGAR